MQPHSLVLSNTYIKPIIRIVLITTDKYFLLSNTEVIIDDGQEHGWD